MWSNWWVTRNLAHNLWLRDEPGGSGFALCKAALSGFILSGFSCTVISQTSFCCTVWIQSMQCASLFASPGHAGEGVSLPFWKDFPNSLFWSSLSTKSLLWSHWFDCSFTSKCGFELSRQAVTVNQSKLIGKCLDGQFMTTFKICNKTQGKLLLNVSWNA